ncbi:MAG: hypothetical protein ABWZ75_12055, partial [Novosphingobium sp.]
LEKLHAYQEEGDRRSSITRDAVLFALLTRVRTKELRLAVKSEFEDVNGSAPIWRIPPERMKTRTSGPAVRSGSPDCKAHDLGGIGGLSFPRHRPRQATV